MSKQGHPTNLTPEELREWHRHIRAAIRAGADWEFAHHRADSLIEMARWRRGATAVGDQSVFFARKPGDVGPLPEGWVYIGTGDQLLRQQKDGLTLYWNPVFSEWRRATDSFWLAHVHYAAPADSEVVRALGLGGNQ